MKPMSYLFVSMMILFLLGGLAQGMAPAIQNQDNAETMTAYQDMDKNSDSRIDREEWKAYFDNHDWNADGFLSGDERNPGASRWQNTSAPSDQFDKMDRNKNGVISRGEWTGTTQDFDRLDRDRSGHLSVNEFYQRPGSDQFSDLDDNNNGVIIYDEWSPNSRRSFDALDLNGDGKLTRDEFYNQQQYVVSVFRELDQNNDGMISRSEWRGTDDAFNRLDINGDNFLGENEFNAPQSNNIAVQILQEIFKKR